jgi:hypothetical protein
MFYPQLWVITLLFAGPLFAEPASSLQAPYCGKSDFDTKADSSELQQEAACLEKLSSLASRKEKELFLKLSNGNIKTLKSFGVAACEADTVNCMNYFLVGYYSMAKLYIVYVTGYEGSAFMLMDSNDGTEFRLEGAPHFSPDGSSFMVVAEGDGDYALAIGVLVNNRPILKWTRATNIFERWNFQSWVDDHQVALKVEGGTICPKGNCQAAVTQTGNNWALKVKTKV